MIKLEKLATKPSDEFTKKECTNGLIRFQKKLFELQNVFYADSRFALLIILQGVDTSGKDGVIRHVMTRMNPMGINVKSFKQPTKEEMKHDFLWRIFPHFPAKGMIGVFNRSYYEDILVPFMEETLTKDGLLQRCQLINGLEQHLEKSNIHILKFFLHLSKEEQAIRIKERLIDTHKHWKYTKEDKVAADRWEEYQEAYQLIIKQCNEQTWHIIPADKRWYRNYAVAKVITDHLESLHLKFPNM